MAAVLVRLLHWLEPTAEIDPRMDRFLLTTASQIDTILAAYLLFVLKLGPEFMKITATFDLKKIIIVYDALQIFANLYIFQMFFSVWDDFKLSGISYERTNTESNLIMLQIHYFYVLLKYFDLIETLFFVLRKKDKQISFLHVYHHTGVLLAGWISGRYFPGGEGLFVVFFNTLTHAIMYCYYLVSAFTKIENVWWKKYVTIIQLVQHCLVFMTLTIGILNPNCHYPKMITGVFMCNVLLIIYLFANFYRNAYCQKTK